MKMNMTNFRVFGPDETTSNKLQAVYEVSKKFWIAENFPEDQDGGELSTDGRVMDGGTRTFDARKEHGERSKSNTTITFKHLVDLTSHRQAEGKGQPVS
jgi:hypothetical protein